MPVRSTMNSKVCVSTWLKGLMYFVSLVPGLVSLLIFVPHGSWPGGNTWTLAIGFLVLMCTSCYLVSRFYYLSSIVITENGLEQSSVSFRSGLRRHVQLGWDEVAEVSFSGLSFRFVGTGGERFELNSSLYNDMQETIRTVRNLLPARLQAQLQG